MKKYIVAVLLISSIFLYSYFTEGIVHSIMVSDTEHVVDYIQSFGALSLVVFFFLVVLEVVVAPLTSVLIYAAGGILFGTFWGGTIALAGNIIGSYIAFIIARRLGRGKFEDKDMSMLNRYSERYGIYAIFLLRINPLTSSDLLSYAAGLTEMKTTHFLWGTGLGLLPSVYLQAYIGKDIIGQSPLLRNIFLIFSLLYLVLFIAGVIYIRARKKGKEYLDV